MFSKENITSLLYCYIIFNFVLRSQIAKDNNLNVPSPSLGNFLHTYIYLPASDQVLLFVMCDNQKKITYLPLYYFNISSII